MAAGKKKAKPADTQEPTAPAAAQASSNDVAPVATKEGVPTYRVDLGESLPPQKKAGVE